MQKNGFEVVLFDKEPGLDTRSRDWTILIHRAMRAMTKLLPEHVLANLSQAVCNPYLDFNRNEESLPCYNGLTGEVLFRNPTPGVPTPGARRVSRQRLRKVLADGLDIKWGRPLSHLERIEDSVRLTFEGGEVDDVDYVLGTDGVSSKVRELLLGVEAAQALRSGFVFASRV